ERGGRHADRQHGAVLQEPQHHGRAVPAGCDGGGDVRGAEVVGHGGRYACAASTRRSGTAGRRSVCGVRCSVGLSVAAFR
ncbi:hypothetical protein ABTL46_22810, partial [Acinetobacter baumannii]